MENKISLAERCKKIKCCVVIPTYNNDRTLLHVINDVKQYVSDIIVVNDGCTDDTNDILNRVDGIDVVVYERNRGKGYAIRQGFKRALELGFDYVITLDSDGQHYAKDLATFIRAIEEKPGSLFIGSRFMEGKNQKKASSFANKFSNFWFQVETGVTLPDTQSGYRLYPVRLMEKKRWFCNKYEFEIEIIVRAVWNSINVECIPVDVFYPEKEERITHFRPFKDFFRISVLNTILVTLALLIFRPRLIYREFKGKSLKQIWKEQVALDKESKVSISAAIALGGFMGVFPVWGYQLLLGFIIAHLFKLNKALFFISANISLPPMIPFILYLSYVLGSFLLGQGSWHVDTAMDMQAISGNIKQYIIGAIGLSFIIGLLFYFASLLFLTIIKKSNV